MTAGQRGYNEDMRLAHVLADQADAISLDRFRAQDLEVATKPDLTPVTDADHAVEEQLRLRVMDDPDLGPLARNLVLLWYTGGWTQLPADWRGRNGANTLDSDRLLSARSWTEGLMWPAIGAHATGAKPPGFASWIGPPSVGEQP